LKSDEGDISVSLVDPGLVLIFDAESQILARMELITSPKLRMTHPEWSSYAVTFDGTEVWSGREASDCKKVISAFPPTTLGTFTDTPPAYEIHYKQGVSFRFDIKDRAMVQHLRDRHEHPTEYKGYSPSLRMMSVTRRNDTEHSVSKRHSVEIFPNEGIRIHFPDQKRVFIELGAGMQSLISSLGPPNSTYREEVFNYFTYGMDVKVPCAGSRTVSEIVLHTNLPGQPEFGRYERVWFQLDQKRKKTNEGAKCQVNNLSKLPDLIEAFGDPGPPLVIDDTQVGSRHFYSFPSGVAIEITQAGFISSVHLSISRRI